MFSLQFRAQLAAVRFSRLVHRAWASPHFDTAIACGLFLCVMVLVVVVLNQPVDPASRPQ